MTRGASAYHADDWKGLGLSVVLHAVLFLVGGWLWVHPVQYGVAAGASALEVQLIAAPPQAQPAVVKVPEPEAPSLPPVVEAVVEPTPEPTPEPMPAPASMPANEPVGDGSSPDAGLDAATQYASTGAQIQARPNYLRNPAPRYPEASRRNGEEGVVLLTAEVDRTGKPTQVAILHSSGFERLDRSAVEAVRRWTFEPATAGPLKVDSTVQIPVRFRLSDRS